MARIEKTVFISYRRTNAPWALAVFQNLNNNGYDVFFDFNGIASGDFESVILENIKARAHFLVLLTPSALERCGESGDWLRREIETALETKRNIVPLMLEGFDFNTPVIANQLTGKLATLKRYNALHVPVDYFIEAMERLCRKHLNVELEGVLHPASPKARHAAEGQRTAANSAPSVSKEELTAQQWIERGSESEDLDKKLRCYTQALRIKPDSAVAHCNRGCVYGNKGDLTSALKDFDEAIRINPGYLTALYNRGLARSRNNIAGALEDFNQAIQLKSDDADSFCARGLVRQKQGDLVGALLDLNRAIQLKPDYPTAFFNRSLVYEDKQDLPRALEDLNKAIQLKPDYAKAFYNRSLLRRVQCDLAGALKDLTKAISLDPSFPSAFNNRGRIRQELGDVSGALEDYTEAIRLNPFHVSAFVNRAVILGRQGDTEGALQDYSKAIRLQPDYASALYNRALIFRKMRKNEAAIADFQKYLNFGHGVHNGDQIEVEQMIRDLTEEMESENPSSHGQKSKGGSI